MEITKMLTISTANIKQSTGEFLYKVCSNQSLCHLTVYGQVAQYEDGAEYYGWFIYCRGNCFSEIPDDLVTAIQFAQSIDCDWICIDRDAEVLTELPTYKWE